MWPWRHCITKSFHLYACKRRDLKKLINMCLYEINDAAFIIWVLPEIVSLCQDNREVIRQWAPFIKDAENNHAKSNYSCLLIKYHLFKFFHVFPRTHSSREQMFSLNYFAKRGRGFSPRFLDMRIISRFKPFALCFRFSTVSPKTIICRLSQL